MKLRRCQALLFWAGSDACITQKFLMRKNTLTIPLRVLGNAEKEFVFEEKADIFPVLADMEQQGEVVFSSPVRIQAMVCCSSDHTCNLKGQVEARLGLKCGRCLKEFVFPLKTAFSLVFVRMEDDTDEEAQEEREMAAEEAGMIPFTGEELDLFEAVQEQVIMALPVRPLCREDCQGLCPVCGADRNVESCTCGEKVVDPRWKALSGLKISPNDSQK